MADQPLKKNSLPFIEARFFDPAETRSKLERRFAEHLRNLRAAGLAAYDSTDRASMNFDLQTSVTPADTRRITARAKRILEWRSTISGLSHLKAEDRERLEVLRDGARLIHISSEHRADELAADLHAGMPWLVAATEVAWHAMRRSVREGWAGFRMPPMLLDGPPGIGKSHFARQLGALLAAPATVMDATTENASFGLVGTQRGWGTSYPGRVIETVLQTRIANPVIVVDEVEKAGTVASSNGHSFSLTTALLPLLEPLTAKRWSCPYFQVKFDMSWVIWILTSNDSRLLPEPLRSRCPPLQLRHLTAAELGNFVRREGAKREISETAIEAIAEVLAHPSLRDHRPSLRVTIASLEGLLARLASCETTASIDMGSPMSMAKAAYRFHWPIGRIVKMVLNGRLKRFGKLPDEVGFGAFLVDGNELQGAFYGSPMAAFVTRQSAAQTLHVDISTVDRLLRTPSPFGHPYVRRVTPLRGKGKYTWHIEASDLTDFSSAHISLAALAHERNTSADQLKTELQLKGITPILTAMRFDYSLYQRADFSPILTLLHQMNQSRPMGGFFFCLAAKNRWCINALSNGGKSRRFYFPPHRKQRLTRKR